MTDQTPNDDSPEAPRPAPKKSELTRAKILDAALELLEEQGYAAATMRAIAEKAGVSVGNAYYYFKSKDELVQGFYLRTHKEHLVVAEPAIRAERGFKKRLLAAMRTKLETIEPYHDFAGVLFKTAADPKSPLNPFSEASQPVRAEATALFTLVLDDPKLKLPKDLAAELPDLLWTWQMGVVMYWVHDESPGRRKTWFLMERTVDLIAKLVTLSSLKIMSPVRRSALKLVKDLREGGESAG